MQATPLQFQGTIKVPNAYRIGDSKARRPGSVEMSNLDAIVRYTRSMYAVDIDGDAYVASPQFTITGPDEETVDRKLQSWLGYNKIAYTYEGPFKN